MNLGHLVFFFFLNSGNLICRNTGISMYFRESLEIRGNESRLYLNWPSLAERQRFQETSS